MTVQAFIALFGLTTMYLSLSGGERGRRVAPFVGITAQPFWLYATWTSGQTGMFILCLAYTCIYAQAAVAQTLAWIERRDKRRRQSVLTILRNTPGLSGLKIVERSAGVLSRGNVYHVLERLVDDGLVTEQVIRKPHRALTLWVHYLTEEGRAQCS